MFRKKYTVGENIRSEDIREFYYTYSSSAFPPEYQRYRFFTEEGKHFFYHEKREGEVWPLTEKYITVCGTVELTEEEWQEFFGYLKDGSVKEREESLDSGDAGPWLYLYWKNDRGSIQQYDFSSLQKERDFEAFCLRLKEADTGSLTETKKKDSTALKIKINEETVEAEWEDNDSVLALLELAQKEPLVIEMEMYGDFEQVGEIGYALPADDQSLTAEPGDIMLYEGDRIVLFYGSNIWEYTKLGRIRNQSRDELIRLLGNGNAVLTIETE